VWTWTWRLRSVIIQALLQKNNINRGSVQTGDHCGIKDYNWYAIPAANPENVKLDDYAGHEYDGRYHYHGDNEALSFLRAADVFNQYGSPVVGFAPDGFPIYGHYFYDENITAVRKALSGWQIKVDFENGRTPLEGAAFPPPPIETHDLGIFVEDWEFVEDSGDLDECNGMTDAFGNYGYYYTEKYPYGPLCTYGTPDDSFTKDQCQYNPGNNACTDNAFAFVVSSSHVEHGHGHEHEEDDNIPPTNAAQAYSSESVAVIAAIGVVVLSVV